MGMSDEFRCPKTNYKVINGLRGHIIDLNMVTLRDCESPCQGRGCKHLGSCEAYNVAKKGG